MSNTRLWDTLGKTDPSHTKGFKRAGGFSGTAIKPMWSFRRMTEQFGPCGLGWGVNEPSFQVVPGCDGEVLVYCTVSVWYGEGTGDNERNCVHSPIFGVGGDKVVVKQTSGLRSDDEAFKKAYTDAIGNALKLIGVGADVHMGLFDDSKYVNEMRQEFAEEPKQAPSTPKPKGKTVAERKAAWASLMEEVKQEGAKGFEKIDAYMLNAETQNLIDDLGDYKSDFIKEVRQIRRMTQAAQEASGQPVGKIMERVMPDFTKLDTSPDPLEELLDANQGDN